MSGTKKSIGAITVAVAAFGGVVMLGTAASAAVTGLHQAGPQSGRLTEDVRGVSAVDVEVAAAQLRLEFADVDEAELRIDGASSNGWTLRRTGASLEVRGPDRGINWWGPLWIDDEDRVTVVLPRALEGIDADLTLEAGALDVDGDFAKLDLHVNAGSLRANGEARVLNAELNAGRADIDLAGVESAIYTVNAGRVNSTLTDVPSAVRLSVSAGELDLVLPDDEYDVTQEVSAGSFESALRENRGSDNRITASVSAGSATLRPGSTTE